MAKQTEPVELHDAYMWDCPECGRENFLRTITRGADPEERKTLIEEEGVPEDEIGEYEFNMVPCEVECQHCKVKCVTTDCLEAIEGMQLDDDE